MASHTPEQRPLPLVGVVADGRTYRQIAYLLLSFPFGVFYFVALITGISLSVGLSLIWVGIPLLLALLVFCDGLISFEHRLASELLGISTAAPYQTSSERQGLWSQLRQRLASPATWSGLLFLLIKFPLGLASFIITTTLLAMSLGLIAAPLYYQWVPMEMGFNMLTQQPIEITTLPQALLCSLAGLVFGVFSLYALKALALFHRVIAAQMLGASGRGVYQISQQESLEQPQQSRPAIHY
jgi:hypothetical protein